MRAAILASFPYSGLFHIGRWRGASLMRRNFLKARLQEKLAFGTGFYRSVQSLQKQKFQTASQGKGRCVQIFQGGTTKKGEERQDHSFLLGDITGREKESGWYNPLLEDTTGKRGESQVPSWAIPL